MPWRKETFSREAEDFFQDKKDFLTLGPDAQVFPFLVEKRVF